MPRPRQPNRPISCEANQRTTTKRCARCKTTKPLDTDHWGTRNVDRMIPAMDEDGEWTSTAQRVERATTYCRDCSNELRKKAAKEKRLRDQLPPVMQQAVVDLLRGPCDSCGMLAERRERGDEGIFCLICQRLLDSCGWDLDTARSTWVAHVTHLADERRLDREWAQRTDRVRRAHQGNLKVDDSTPPHVQCVWLERMWRAVVNFLATSETRESPQPVG